MKVTMFIYDKLNESKSDDKLAVWKSQIENNTNEQLLKLLNRLYRDFDLFDFNTDDSSRFYMLKSKIDYLENKLNLSNIKGRILR
jgi:hypothetical protein